MQRFLLTRVVQSLVTLVVISMVVFVLARASGDPVMLMLSSDATPQDIAVLRQSLGLDRPLPQQYWVFVKNVVRGNLGESIRGKKPVIEMIKQRLPNSLKLGLFAMAISLLAAFLLGVTAAVHRGGALDAGVKLVAVLGQSVPSFWLAIIAMDLFATRLQILPTAGKGGLAHYVLPGICLGWVSVAGMMRLLRSSMLDVLDSEFVKLARIKGVPERWVIWKHALKNALIPVMTSAGIYFAHMITGALLIETVFAWPGIGRLMYESVMARDFPVIQGSVLVVAMIVVLVNLIVDGLYGYVDSRIQHST